MKELIYKQIEFDRLIKEYKTIIDPASRLPDYVFKPPIEKYCIFEHSALNQPGFGVCLAALAKMFADERITYMSVEPDPISYYHDHFGFFGMASFASDTVAERYYRVMTRDGEVDSFLYRGGDVGVFWGSSLKWAISCSRIDLELAILGIPGFITLEQTPGLRCLNSMSAGSFIRSQHLKNPAVSDRLVNTLQKNYFSQR